jgi:redox-sensitive bicupin YhaK (pirin superfamily)
LWINTPAAHKMDQPQYFPLSAQEAPEVQSEDGKVITRIFSGEVLGKKGPISSHTEVNAATIELKKGGKVSIPLPANHNVVLYLLDGKLNVEGYGLAEGLHAVLFKQDGEGVAIEALEDTRVLLLSGKPLNEEMVHHGPFVMNTQTQILEAMRDYQMGKMGVLIEE